MQTLWSQMKERHNKIHVLHYAQQSPFTAREVHWEIKGSILCKIPLFRCFPAITCVFRLLTKSPRNEFTPFSYRPRRSLEVWKPALCDVRGYWCRPKFPVRCWLRPLRPSSGSTIFSREILKRQNFQEDVVNRELNMLFYLINLVSPVWQKRKKKTGPLKVSV